MSIEPIILSHLVFNEVYARKAIPFLKTEYFHNRPQQVVFDLVNTFVQEYNAFPSKEALYVSLTNQSNLNEDLFKETQQIIQNLSTDNTTNMEWLIDQTEKFCQSQAVINALRTSIAIVDDKTGTLSKGSIPKLLSDALSVSFDSSIGHDFLNDYEARFDQYHAKEKKIPFDLEMFNKITKNGVSKKTLNVIMAGTGVGKTIFLCHFAAANLVAGYRVLYITLEMAEERIAERIDANVLDIQLNRLTDLSRNSFRTKIQKIKTNTAGRLIIKEYPTAAAGAQNFRYLLNELKIKRNFVPDIIYIDYINICTSSRIKMGSNVSSYSLIKSIAEELRGLGVECDVPIMTATQTNRPGFNNSDPGLENTAESFGLPATADFMVALVTSEELEKTNQIMVKQLKNRYNDQSYFRRFVIGLDKTKMRLYNTETGAQDKIIDDTPVMDKTKFGVQDEIMGARPLFDKNLFRDFQ